MVPPLMGAAQATTRLLADRPLSELAGWLRLLAFYDVAFVTMSAAALSGRGGRMTTDLTHARSLMRRGRVLVVLGLAAIAAGYVRALLYTPEEASQGLAQKIFYVHVPAAWSAMMAFGLVGVASALYLWLEDPRLDRFAAASAEVGVAFGVGHADHRPDLGQADLGHLVDLGHAAVDDAAAVPALPGLPRASFRHAMTGANGPATARCIGLMSLVLVPFIHLTVYLFRTLHPQPIVLKPSAPSLPPEMLISLLWGVGAASILYLGFVTTRYGIGLAQEALEDARRG